MITVVQEPAAASGLSALPSITLDATDVLAGDVIIWIGAGGDNFTIAVPSGFTEVCAVINHTTGDDVTHIVGYKVADGSEESTALTGSMSASNRWIVIAGVYRGVDNVTPVDVVDHASNHTTSDGSGNPTSSGITTVTDGALRIVASLMNGPEDCTVASSNGGDAEIGEVLSNTDLSAMATREIIASAGVQSGDTHTYNGTRVSADSHVMLDFALRPAAAGINVSLGVNTGGGAPQTLTIGPRALISGSQAFGGGTPQTITPTLVSGISVMLPVLAGGGDPGQSLGVLHELSVLQSVTSAETLLAGQNAALVAISGGGTPQTLTRKVTVGLPPLVGRGFPQDFIGLLDLPGQSWHRLINRRRKRSRLF